MCAMPAAFRDRVPESPPPEEPYETLGYRAFPRGDVPIGVGHLHLGAENAIPDLPPGEYDWLGLVELPLSPTAGAAPSAWIARGWIVQDGAAPVPLSRRALLETGYEEVSFVVLEGPYDGWFRIRFAEGDDGTAWVPECALRESPVRLDFTTWGAWLLSGSISPLYVPQGRAESLRSAPSETSALVVDIEGDHSLEPLELRGDWMRVRLRQPSDFCDPDVVATTREGWIRWYDEGLGPRVWYFTRGC
jgi:hypothetical protein